MTAPDPRLAVEAAIDVSVDGETVRVDGYGDLVVVDAPSFAAARALRRGVGTLAALAPTMTAGVTVDVRVRGVSVARIAPGSPGRLAPLLGTAPARPSLGGLVRAFLRSLLGR